MKLQEILEEYNLNKSKNPKGTDKGDYLSYVDFFYEKYFFKFKNREISLLEIGYRHGASLALWSIYFPKANIFGIDNGSDGAVDDSPENKPEDDWLNRKNITT